MQVNVISYSGFEGKGWCLCWALGLVFCLGACAGRGLGVGVGIFDVEGDSELEKRMERG